MQETMKRFLDFIITTDEPEAVCDALLSIENSKEVIAKGETKVSIVIEDVYDVNVDFRIVRKEEFATTLHHFTGSKEHNVAMRQLAKAQGEKINEYGVENEETGRGNHLLTEEEFFNHFDLHYHST